MLTWEIWFALVPGLILFLYGIEQFSREIQRVAGERFRSYLAKLTKTPVRGAFLGALTTAIIQSSTATTVIAVGLVNAGTLSFAQSLGIMFGANVGTTITAQLVAFKLTGFAPFFILLGFVLSIVGGRYRFLGRPIFYFGLVFFSLSLVSDAIEPVRTDPDMVALFSQFSDIFIALAAGILFTILVQSSSVTTGIVVLLAGSGLLTLGQSIPIILGANVGTTATSLLAASRMDLYAKRAATAHFLFNVGGVLIFLPFLSPFAGLVAGLGGTVAQEVANAHLIFNLTAAIIFLAVLEPFKRLVERVVPGEEKEIVFHTKYLGERVPRNNIKALGLIEKELHHLFDVTQGLFDESLGVIKSADEQKANRVAKLEALNDFLDDRIEKALFALSARRLDEKEAERVVLLVRISNAVEQLGDKGRSLGYLAVDVGKTGLYLSPESIVELGGVYEKFRGNVGLVGESLPRVSPKNVSVMRKNDIALRELTNKSYQKHMKRMASEKAYAGSAFVEALSILEAANAKVREVRKLSETYRKLGKD